ncbi:hypothetical protein BGW39_011753 [Mortierella sp. 14UC]|nr:hypothetical protein BGW39_011753 [Mortierella sp. 14UC]
MQLQPSTNDATSNDRNNDPHRQQHHHNKHAQEDISSLLIMQTRRRQKTLSSISNFMPLHILLNQPRGVSFSLTVPKSFTIERLARQIEAEYAYLVEREIGYSSFPVIECGALFDHVELPRRRRRHSQGRGSRTNDSSRKPSQDYCENGEEEYEDNDDEDEEDDEDDDGESEVDERDEAESRGVQLRFSDRVEDVLERDSTVHVVNIDQAAVTTSQ